MASFKVLVLTDHANHSSENSLYPMVRAMQQHEHIERVAVATRHEAQNDDFFNPTASIPTHIMAAEVDEQFVFDEVGSSFRRGLGAYSLSEFDAVWLRMPPPLSRAFLDRLMQIFPTQTILNYPKGIWETGSKRFLTNFPEWCPPMQICESIDDIIRFNKRFPIVLKPFRDYGGRGIVRIDGDRAWVGATAMSFDDFVKALPEGKLEYLGVKFLKNVGQGDKRIIVVDGKIMGASLRLPPKDSWICNVAMGGTSHFTKVDEEEKAMIAAINPTLAQMGIVMYGVDTLVGDDGQRVLSEINTTSIGGLPQIAAQRNKPLVPEAIDRIVKRMKQPQFS